MTDIMSRTSPFGLRVQPMVHVKDLRASIAFYEELGGHLLFGSRDGDWALLDFNGTRLSLLAREPGDSAPDRVELQFAADCGLDHVQDHLRTHAPDRIDRGLADEAFGRMVKLRSPDGLLVKLIEVEREVIE